MQKTISIEEFEAFKTEKEQEIEQLKAQIFWFKKFVFGSKSEKNILPQCQAEAIDLFDLDPEETPVVLDSAETQTAGSPRKKRAKDQERQALPEHLERREEVIALHEDHCNCPECGGELKVIGQDVTEELEIIPAQVFVRRIVRLKYACPDESLHGVFRAPTPERVIPKGIAGASLLAYILIAKYLDHLPLERIVKILERQGVRIPKSTMSDWMGRVCEVLIPLLACLKGRMLSARIVNCDETTMNVINNAVSRPKDDGYLWSYIGDRRWVWFDWREGRGRAGPLETLRGFSGEYLQSDGYAVYDLVVEKLGVEHLGCWAHARRKFVEALESGSQKAEGVIALIAKLYGVEKQCRQEGLDSEAVLAKRQAESKPLLEELKLLLNEITLTAVPKGPLGKAVNYALKQWNRLELYCDDGDLEIDNNMVERAIRPVALGRKNWLFAGSKNGAQWAAGFYSLIETAKRHGVDPAQYLSEVLKRITDYADGEDFEELLPDAYAWRINDGRNLPSLENENHENA